MRLLDVAKVAVVEGHLPTLAQSPICAVHAVAYDVCAPGEKTVLFEGDSPVSPTGTSEVISVEAYLPIPVVCERGDEKALLAEAMETIMERALGSYLVSPKDNDGFWVGSAESAESIIAARQALYNSGPILPGRGVLHVDPATVPSLLKDSLVSSKDRGKELYTVWGDPVVTNPAYAGFPAFWTGPIAVFLSPVHSEVGQSARANVVLHDAYMSAVIHVDECTVFRAGPVPTP